MVANAALGRSARHVVLYSEAGEHFHLAVVHLCGNGYFQHAFRRAQDLPQPLVKLQVLGSHIKLNLGNSKRIEVLARSYARYWLRNRFGNARHSTSSCSTGPGCLLPRAQHADQITNARKSRENRSLAKPLGMSMKTV